MQTGEGKEAAAGQMNFVQDATSFVKPSKDEANTLISPYFNPEFNLAAAQVQGGGAAHTSSLPLHVQLMKAAVGGAVKGAMRALIDCILEPLKSCYNSCCDCCDGDEAH
ncbi:hypothetical protein ACP70R_023999 [Stipagrostis hirtigluma subsp. patula]